MKKNVINDLVDSGFKIVQNKDYFKFSLDSVLLAKFIKINYSTKNIIDLCTGNAPIPIFLSKNKKITIFGVEIQKEVYELARESVDINNISNVNLINDDVNNLRKYFPGNTFDIVSCNPPYFKFDNKSIININDIKSIARHEVKIKLEDVISIAAYLLKSRGYFYMVHRTNRLIEIIELLKKYKFGLKQMQIIYSKNDASMFLIEAQKDCKDDVKILSPIFSDRR